MRPLCSSRSFHSACSTAPRLPAARQAVSTSSGTVNSVGVESELRASRLDLVLAERGTVGRRGALLVGRAKADDRPAADEARPRIGQRFLDRAARRRLRRGRRIRTCATAPPGGAQQRPRCATGSVEPSIVMLLSSHSTISRPSLRWPARPIASWLMPSIRQPSPAIDEGAVVDQLVAVDGVEVALGDGHADRHADALPEWAGRHLDAGKLEILRVACGRRAELAEALDVVQRRPLVAGQVEQERRSASIRGRPTG